MKTRDEILRTLAETKQSLTRRFPVRRLALFGSYARGEQRDDSDVDILVDVDPVIGLEFVTLAETIEHALGLPVDLISQRAVHPRHWKEIEADVIDV